MKKLIFLLSVTLISQLFGCTWQTPFRSIADPNDKFVPHLYPLICVSDSGHRMAIWQRDPSSNNANNELVFSHYDPLTNTWSAVQVSSVLFPIEGLVDGDDNDLTTPPMNQTQADLCCFPNGDAQLIWHQEQQNPVSGSGPGIVTSHYTVGSGWSSPPDELETTPRSAHPEITCFASGGAVAVWSLPSSPGFSPFSGSTIRFSYFNGTSWSAAATLDPTLNTGIPHICGDGVGSAVAVWVEQTDSTNNLGTVYASTFTPPAAWSPRVAVSTIGTVYTNIDIDVGCDPAGNAVAAWGDRNQDAAYAAVYDSGTGSWGSPVLITPYSSPDRNQNIPSEIRVCKGDEGNALIVLRTLKKDTPTPPPATYPTLLNTAMIEGVYYSQATGMFSLPTTNPLAQGTPGDPDYLFSNPQLCCGICSNAIATWGYPTTLNPNPNFFVSNIDVAAFNGQTESWDLAELLDYSYLDVFSATYGQNLRSNLACDNDGIIYPIWQWGSDYTPTENFLIATTEGFCGTFIVPTTLQIQAITNRFPFQTECFSLLTWNIYPCNSGVVSVQVLVNGALKATVPGGVTSARIDAVSRGDVVTVRPVSIIGLPGAGESIKVK